eukprot:1116396-Pyramimonas_sp.AAC.1
MRAPIAEGEREYTRIGHQSRKGSENIPVSGTNHGRGVRISACVGSDAGGAHAVESARGVPPGPAHHRLRGGARRLPHLQRRLGTVR